MMFFLILIRFETDLSYLAELFCSFGGKKPFNCQDNLSSVDASRTD